LEEDNNQDLEISDKKDVIEKVYKEFFPNDRNQDFDKLKKLKKETKLIIRSLTGTNLKMK